VYTGEHVRSASLPGMRERTVPDQARTQTFSSPAGYRLCDGAGPSCGAVRAVKQFLTFVSGGPFPVRRSADALAGSRRVLSRGITARTFGSQSHLLCAGLSRRAFLVYNPPGRHLFRHHTAAGRGRPGRRVEFCCLNPPSSAVLSRSPVPVRLTIPTRRTLWRFAFCKRKEVLQDALSRLDILPPAMTAEQGGNRMGGRMIGLR